MKSLYPLSVSVFLLATFNPPGLAATSVCPNEGIGQVLSAQGNVNILRKSTGEWNKANRKSQICEGDTVKTAFRSRAAISMSNDTVLRIKSSSSTQLSNFSKGNKATSLMRIITGVIHFFSRKPSEYDVQTLTATIGIRGTEFVVSANDDQTDLTVFEGSVLAQNDVSPLLLSGGESVHIIKGKPIRSTTLVSPRSQVQWGLYYPPVLSLSDSSSADLRRVGKCAQTGDYECAFKTIDKVADAKQGTEYHNALASLYLAIGDLDQAQASLQKVKAINPKDVDAFALSAVIGVSQNRLEDAARDAKRAVESNGNSVSALIALSYVQQASLDLTGAHDTLATAVSTNPKNALAWSRLAELSLALGNISDSVTEANRSVELDPNTARVHMVRGYTALGQIDTSSAIESFELALTLDSADPMSHLGLGLSMIREGDLAQGRKEIEAAVALDSNSAILRPYLGRAYYEEKRSPLDAEQYAIAKQLDPNDPTAYLFEALRNHSENRPIAASRELQASIERNDNRAVYRGRNALDQDRAARGASLARIYDTLGFTRQGINEASSSLTVDPANDSAHRFLSDSYRKVRRHEISRVSELLQAQMLQDINLNPVQPSVSATNLNIGSGAGDVGLNEFTGLFESNNIQPAISIQSGSNDTRAVEAVVSGVHNSISFSLGVFDYETDGWRENNAQDQQLGNLFVQWAASPKLNLQAEISSRESSEGDLAFNFDPNDFDSTLIHNRDIDTNRLGLRYSPTPTSNILLSHIESERVERKSSRPLIPVFTALGQLPPGPPGSPPPPPCPPVCVPDPTSIQALPYDADLDLSNEGSQTEVQFLLNSTRYNLVAGLASVDIDAQQRSITVAPTQAVALIVPEEDVSTASRLEHIRAYIYPTFNPTASVHLTVGISADDYDDSILTKTISSTNPKLGVRWSIDERQTFRAAAFKVTKPSLASNITLEPTQVAGFNQFFDDVNATQTELLGVAYDFKITKNVSTGIELTSRDMEIPFLFTDINAGNLQSTQFEKQEEQLGRIYLYWTPSNSIAVSGELVSDIFKVGPDGGEANTPVKAETTSLPISVNYFSIKRWYAGITATFVEQEVSRSAASSLAAGKDDFNLIDLSFGYRLPKRLGAITLGVYNVTDEQFMYQDDSYREFRNEPSIGPYFPETTVQFQANLVF